jgi:uncharacterized membrane protein
MEKIQSKTIIMPTNGTIQGKSVDVYAIVASIISAGVVGCFVFLWNSNTAQARSQEQMTNMLKVIEEQRNTLNQMQLDMRDVREKVIRLENNSNKKP